MKFDTQKTYVVATTAVPSFEHQYEAVKWPAASQKALGGVTKRAFDVLLVVLSFPFLVPLFIGICLMIKVTTKGPLFYGHKRVGLGGKSFRCWKFRTMVQNGDEVLASYLAQNPREQDLWQSQRKLKFDPRITPLGAVLRKLSIDELPQLFNILIGEMSIVGPRPVVADELELYGNCADHYLRARPGLTGLWQVSGRSDTSYRFRVTLDRLYVSRWSLMLDMWIVVRTIPAVLSARGAV